jgi:hypothetical protein
MQKNRVDLFLPKMKNESSKFMTGSRSFSLRSRFSGHEEYCHKVSHNINDYASSLTSTDTPGDEVSEEDIANAQRELLEAKATYQVRNSIIENVLTANPILKAVHAGSNASLLEQ